MRNLIFTIAVFLPSFCLGQAHLGSTLAEIKENYPGKEFTMKMADDGTKIASADMPFGTFYYVFDRETGFTDMCLQIPDDMEAIIPLENFPSIIFIQ